MAKAKPSSLLKSISGQVDSDESTSFRYRYGKQEIYHFKKKKRSKSTPNQKRAWSEFAKINKIASIICRDDQLSQPFRAHFNSLPADSRPQILFRSIISDLSSDPDLLAQYLHLLPPQIQV